MLWSWVPSGMARRGSALPTRASALSPAMTVSPTCEAVGHEDVALLAVGVVEQADARRAVGVVLDGRELGRHVQLVAPEVDAPIVLLGAATAVADGHAALLVAAGASLLRLDERLVGLVGGDLLEGRPRHEAAAG